MSTQHGVADDQVVTYTVTWNNTSPGANDGWNWLTAGGPQGIVSSTSGFWLYTSDAAVQVSATQWTRKYYFHWIPPAHSSTMSSGSGVFGISYARYNNISNPMGGWTIDSNGVNVTHSITPDPVTQWYLTGTATGYKNLEGNVTNPLPCLTVQGGGATARNATYHMTLYINRVGSFDSGVTGIVRDPMTDQWFRGTYANAPATLSWASIADPGVVITNRSYNNTGNISGPLSTRFDFDVNLSGVAEGFYRTQLIWYLNGVARTQNVYIFFFPETGSQIA